jgi:periplasmic divalent cation tolerance protein
MTDNLPEQPTEATGHIVVLVTCPGEKANAIAQTLVGESLCACINILPNIRSVYRWEGDVTSEEESLLVMKTMDKIYARLEARIKEIHPYEVPEIICLKIERGSASYLNWLSQSITHV